MRGFNNIKFFHPLYETKRSMEKIEAGLSYLAWANGNAKDDRVITGLLYLVERGHIENWRMPWFDDDILCPGIMCLARRIMNYGGLKLPPKRKPYFGSLSVFEEAEKVVNVYKGIDWEGLRLLLSELPEFKGRAVYSPVTYLDIVNVLPYKDEGERECRIEGILDYYKRRF